MTKEIISKKTRYEFREYLVSDSTLREIEIEFDAADIICDTTFDPQASGSRRSLIEQFYHSLDFSKIEDVQKILIVYQNILARLEKTKDDGSYPIHEYRQKIFPQLCNWLQKDGFLYQNGEIVSILGTSGLQQIKSVAVEFNADYMAQQIKRIEGSVETDPFLAIGSAKELVETCCKTILTERNIPFSDSLDLQKLIKETQKSLNLLPDNISDQAKGAEIIKQMLNNLANLVKGLGELRNLYGSGHGKEGRVKGLSPRHARLAVGAASTLVVFLFETHKEKQN